MQKSISFFEEVKKTVHSGAFLRFLVNFSIHKKAAREHLCARADDEIFVFKFYSAMTFPSKITLLQFSSSKIFSVFPSERGENLLPSKLRL